MDIRNEKVHSEGQENRRFEKRQALPFGLERTITVVCSDDDGQERSRLKCDPDSPYRTFDGTCNNLLRPRWGASPAAFRRYLPPEYADGVGTPRGGYQNSPSRPPSSIIFPARDNAVSDRFCPRKPDPARPLPNPREISTRFFVDSDRPSSRLSLAAVQLGQFADHDISFTPESSRAEGCCENRRKAEGDCFPIRSGQCINFGRSSAFCLNREKPREQMNTLTAFLDASHLYGSSEAEARELREGTGGLLKVSFLRGSAREMLPGQSDSSSSSVLAGDVRAAEMPGLAAMHTVLLREHNRLARHLSLRSNSNSSLDDETLFQNARRILVAEWQNVVYGEYLPAVLGRRNMRKHRVLLPSSPSVRSLYSPLTDPSVRNAFATAAFRFGHSQLQGLVQSGGAANSSSSSTFRLRDHFFRADKLSDKNGRGLDDLLVGMSSQPAQSTDRFITEEVTKHLFPGVDLVARNIQRGRDHGLPSYNAFRRFCGLKPACSWSSPPREISASSWLLLSTLYADPSDIDLFVGGAAEGEEEGAAMGPTFACIVARQFRALKDGDRFFFTHSGTTAKSAGNPAPFTPAQLSALRRRTLRDLVCENTAVARAKRDFLKIQGEEADCRETNSLDLDLFT